MTEPRYILLTVKKITVPMRNGQMQSTHLQPPIRKLFVLPLSISLAQHDRSAEIEVGTAGAGMVMTMAEDFLDVLEALDNAPSSGRYIVRPMARSAIASAVAQAGVTGMRKDIEAALEEAFAVGVGVVNGAEDFARRAEGAKHQDEAVEPLADDDRAKIDAAWEKHKAARPVSAGDLRIATDHVNHWIEVANNVATEDDKPSYEWARFGVPPELLPIYETAEAARQAVKLAGYARRLIEAKS